jgi:site-specific recombinase XerD
MNTEILEYRNNSNTNIMLQDTNKHFIEYFLDMRARKSICTSTSYERDIKDFFVVNDVTEITMQDIKKVSIVHAQNYIIKLSDKHMSSATISRKISSLSALYRWLLKYQDNSTGFQLIQYNPFGNLKEEKPVINNKETEFLTQDECKILLTSIDTSTILGYRNKTILSLALTTALRKSEMINIKIKDITTNSGYDVVKVTRKGGKEDIVKLQKNVLEMMNGYIELTGRNRSVNGEEYLFIGHSNKQNMDDEYSGNKLDASTLNAMIKKVCKKAGIDKDLTMHSTRHSCLTMAIIGGATIDKVMSLASHKNISTTSRYLHSVDKLKNNASDVIDIF